MSFFSDLAGSVGDFFAGPSGGLIGLTAAVAAPIIGSVISSNANERAASADAEARQRAADTIAASNREASERLNAVTQQTAPAVARLTQLSTADPTVMSPQQRIELGDAERRAKQRLAVSGMRGNGRAVTASVNDTLGRYQAGAVERNRLRGDQATNTLAGQNFANTSRMATLDTSLGRDLANLDLGGGENEAALRIAQGRNTGAAIGAIGGSIAGEAREMGRRRAFERALTSARGEAAP